MAVDFDSLMAGLDMVDVLAVCVSCEFDKLKHACAKEIAHNVPHI